MRRAEIEALVDDVLRETLAQKGFQHATIHEKLDESGEAGLYIDVHFEPPPTDVRGLPIMAVIAELRRRLLDGDEERFPYVHYVFADDGELDDEPKAAGA